AGIGFTQLYPSFSSVAAKRIWVLNDLYVAAQARRLGVAKKLMDTAKEFAMATNARGLALETARDTSAAQRLYEALGYRKEDGYHYFLALDK
ncbi:GNAT family N-acetyltransferase, partial [Vibrio diabolicus]|uniref:GNAT family N-acetyltransferase n=1 Tax=Vibrio diabolicus TaxID=50719 RepID=UPI00211B5E7B